MRIVFQMCDRKSAAIKVELLTRQRHNFLFIFIIVIFSAT
jgi:hypothetical protein